MDELMIMDLDYTQASEFALKTIPERFSSWKKFNPRNLSTSFSRKIIHKIFLFKRVDDALNSEKKSQKTFFHLNQNPPFNLNDLKK